MLSLPTLWQNCTRNAGKFDSAAWFSEASSAFFNTTDSWTKTGDYYYQAFTFAVDPGKQAHLAEKAREYYKKVLDKEPNQLEVKNSLAMTYVGGAATMQAVGLLREVLAEDPKNEQALFNLGMLSFQSDAIREGCWSSGEAHCNQPQSYARKAVVGNIADEYRR